ncbi:N-lysine methyltransferase SMYD2 isoform X1 [Petromyzon marinus]|uniref:[histone H3]-lysine(4) N-trimethyltransferase n=3 Tax=Petromyzon marinus TaxID=7757 RepID=A0AAJ7TKA2_PETMA|nr:N-lysine methyltransferase SMYD2 isoform X1 [Petromyzon marinus]
MGEEEEEVVLSTVERFSSPGKGRGLRAARGSFSRGDLLLVAQPFSATLADDERGRFCDHCFARKDKLSHCGKCKQAYYCNAQCQRADWPSHRLDCDGLRQLGPQWTPGERVRLVARILIKLKMNKDKCASEGLLTLEEMESHMEELDNEQREAIGQEITALHHYYSRQLEIPGNEEMVEIFSKVKCNGFTVEDEELNHIGAALYPSLALLNHSCDHNCVVTFRGSAAQVRALREIKQGEELFISYIDLLYPTEDRNERLREMYFFTCHCCHCQSQHLDDKKLAIRELSEPPSPESVREVIKYSKFMVGEFRTAKRSKTGTELLEMCERCLERQASVLSESNVYLLHMAYQAMGVCLFVEQWERALDYGLQVIKQYCKLYPRLSLNVASLWLKIGQLQTNLDHTSAATKSFSKALAIMEVTHGKDHPYIEELRTAVKSRAGKI